MDSEGMSLARGLLRNLPFYRLIDSISINPATIQQIKTKSGYVSANNIILKAFRQPFSIDRFIRHGLIGSRLL